MRWFIAGIVVALSVSVASAQQPVKTPVVKNEQPEAQAMTPEMWAYLQELRRQDDPKLNARRAAQWKSEQRRLRLESQKWYGYSNLRPMANPTPFFSSYSPGWSGGGGTNGFDWYGGSYPSTAVYVDQQVYYHR